MKKYKYRLSNNKKFPFGVTLVELMVTMAISSVLAMAVGALLIGGHRSWQKTYDTAHRKIKQDARAIMITLGTMGRKSNRLGYTLYNDSSGSFSPAVPQTGNPQEVVYGDAVEFKYWSASGPSSTLLDVTNTGTDYAFFYIKNDELKVDYGKCPPGAVPGGNGARNTSNITTIILAENVIPDPNGAFNHTTISGVGQGCVRINVTLKDVDDPNETIQVMTATLMRNIWPR